ncbi:secreted RxLR effector protein 161-like [Rutidosis leptorrhynchoides]|uniref:secreted RxLR effector protein 161-like n=1 Tax=Rutidosis leptorrhynchoides TaxID=125765 RepID=UPI003A99FAE9
MSTLIEPNLCVNCDPIDKDQLLTNITEYQKLVGRLVYLTLTRPDISFAVHILSQYMHAPLQSHLNLTFRTLKYLKGSPGKGIHLVKGNNLDLYAYCDSDWAKCKMNRKSVTGYLVFFCGSLVSWKSKKQSVVSRSSAEAEYRSMASTACEIIWIKNLLLDFGIKSLNNLSDILTNGVSIRQHHQLSNCLGLIDLFQTKLEEGFNVAVSKSSRTQGVKRLKDYELD